MKKDYNLWAASGIEKDPVYADNERGGSNLAIALQNYVEAHTAEIEKLNGSQLDHLDRVLSDCLSLVKRTYWGRHFQMKRASWPRCFWTRLEKLHGYSNSSLFNRWWDHGERWRHLDSNRVYYVSHPYELGSGQLQQLAALEKAGYQVEITGRSLYYPGQTLCVRVSKKDVAPCENATLDQASCTPNLRAKTTQ